MKGYLMRTNISEKRMSRITREYIFVFDSPGERVLSNKVVQIHTPDQTQERAVIQTVEDVYDVVE